MGKIILVSLFMILSLSIVFIFNISVGAEDRITLIHPWQNEPVKDFFDYATNQFQEQNPNVNFEVFSYFNIEYEHKINMLLASENHPDIFLVKAGNLGNQIISKGQALNLTQYYEEDSYWADKIISSTVKPFTHDNQIYGVPFTTNVGMLAYNKEIFDELNLEVPETWDEFIEILKILKEKEYIPLGYSNKTTLHGGFYMTALNQRILGLETVKEDYTINNGDFGGKGYLKALEKMDALKPYMNEYPRFLSRVKEREMFQNGEIAITFLHALEIPYFTDMEYKWDIFNFPEIKGGKGDPEVIIGTPEGFMISKETENPVLAMDFLKFITSQETAKIWVEMTDTISTTEGAVNKDNSHPVIVEIVNKAKNADDIALWIDIATAPEISRTYVIGIQEMFDKEQTPEQLIKEIRAVAKELRTETE